MDTKKQKLQEIDRKIREKVNELELAEAKLNDLPWFHSIIKQPGFIITRLNRLNLRSAASLRLCRVSLAVQRYRLANGKLPEKIDEIAPRFIDAVPLDPFDGKPIRYKKLDKGYVVYSVGKDGVDNGGLEMTAENKKGEYDEAFTVKR